MKNTERLILRMNEVTKESQRIALDSNINDELNERDGKVLISAKESIDNREYELTLDDVPQYQIDAENVAKETENLLGQIVKYQGQKVIFKGMKSMKENQIMLIRLADESIKEVDFKDLEILEEARNNHDFNNKKARLQRFIDRCNKHLEDDYKIEILRESDIFDIDQIFDANDLKILNPTTPYNDFLCKVILRDDVTINGQEIIVELD